MTTIGVVGLGAMGGRIAARLLGQGHQVVVWNRTPSRADDLIERGAQRAADPAGAARDSEVVLTMVADDGALDEVVEGTTGIAAGIGTGTLVQMSTVSQAALRRAVTRLPAKAGVLDAPVLGSIAEAQAGTLRIYAGGQADVLQRCRPILDRLGTVVHVGGIGSGTAAKLVANATLFGVLGLLGEVLALAERLGLSMDTALEVLAATPLGAQAERRRPALVSGEYPARFALSLAVKDADLIAGAAGAGGALLPVVQAARSWLHAARDDGAGGRDYSYVLAHILQQHRRPAGPPPPDPDHDDAART